MNSIIDPQTTCNKYFLKYNNNSSAYYMFYQTLKGNLKETLTLHLICKATIYNLFLNKEF